MRAGSAPDRIRALVGARAEQDESLADLRAGRARAVRGWSIPEDDEWPALPAARPDRSRPAAEPADHRAPVRPDARALVPPVALWVRGPGAAGRAGRPVRGHRRVAGLHRLRRARRRRARHQLGERGWTVVSGGAFGIDAAAHRGALAAEAPTLAVLACGVDRPYPAAHGALFAPHRRDRPARQRVAARLRAARHRFLVRNRLIAALTRGTVVVEAAARSGAQATANRAHAARAGRSWSCPGPVTSAMSVGCHELLRDEEAGATLVASAAHVIEAVGGLGRRPRRRRPTGRPSPRDGLSDLAARVLDACPVRTGVSPERLAAIAGCDVLEVLRVLPALELAELVRVDRHRLAARPASRSGRAADGALPAARRLDRPGGRRTVPR